MSTSSLPIFPLPEVLLFPGTYLPLHIFEPRYRMMLDYCMESGNEMAIAPLKAKKSSEDKLSPIATTFGWGVVIQKDTLPDGRSNIILEGKGIAKLVEYQSLEPFRIGIVEKKETPTHHLNDPEYLGILTELLVLTKRILLTEGADDSLIMKMNQLTKHPHPVDFLSSILNYEFAKKQELLETEDPIEKSYKLLRIVESLNLRE